MLATRLLLTLLLLGGAAAGPLQAQTAQFAGWVTALGGGFNQPQGVGVDKSGNVYVADTSNGLVKEIPLGCTSQNCVTTLGGGFNQPRSVAVDTSGNVYVADFANQALYEMPAGCTSTNYNNNLCTITTLVDEKKAPGNTLNGDPAGAAVDGGGNVYVADFYHVYQVPVGCTSQTCVTLLGGGFDQPRGVAVDARGNIYVNDNAGPSVYEIPVGCTAANYTNNLCTIATLGGGLSYPYGAAVDGNGDVYVANAGDGEIQEIPAGCTSANYANNLCTITTLGGGFSGSNGVAVDQSGNVYVADTGNNAVKEIALHGVNFGSLAVGQKSTPMTLYFTFTGTSATSNVSESALTLGVEGLDFLDVGTGTCHSNRPPYTYNPGDSCTVDVTFSPKFAGTRSGAVDLFNSANSVIATAYVYGIGVAPQLAFSPFTQTALGGGFASPYGVTVDAGGNIYVADSDSTVVYQMPAGCSSSSCVTSLGGGFGTPESVAVDGAGNIYVADDVGIHDVEKIPVGCGSSTCVQSTTGGIGPNIAVAMDGGGDSFFIASGFSGNGVYELPLGCLDDECINFRGGFNEPMGLAVDANDNIYVADTGNNAVKEMPLSCLVSTAAAGKSAPCATTTLGGGFSGPTGVALDASGNIYVADYGNGAVKVMPAGCLSSSCVTTLPGSFVHPRGVALDQSGNIYVADLGNPPQSNPAVYELTVTTPPSLGFANTSVGSQSTDSPQTAIVRNIGNAPLTFPIPLTGENPSVAANFTLDASTTCPEVSTSSSAGTLAAGASCNLGVDFVPTEPTTISGSVTLTDNTLNANPAVTQSIGLSGTGVPTVSVTIGASPAGPSFTVDGAAPATEPLSWNIGSQHTIATTTPQTFGGVQYNFTGWSDGGAISHTVTAAANVTSYTAGFSTSYLLSVTVETGGVVSSAGGTASVPVGYYAVGSVEAISATPNPGYYFAGWTDSDNALEIEGPEQSSTNVFINAVENLIVDFEPIPGYVVTTTADTSDGSCSPTLCSLRDAITAADANVGGAGNITFQSGLTGTITLTSPLPTLNGEITITGPGANLITVSGNNSTAVGNIFVVESGAVVAISGLTIANGNSTVFGGGGILNSGTLTVSSCVVSNNTSSSGGGGILSEGERLTIANSTFSGNTSVFGGGVDATVGALTIGYSTFSGNVASRDGGGLFAGQVTAAVSYSTFSENTATAANGAGGAIYANNAGTLTVADSIFAQNGSPKGAGISQVNGGASAGTSINASNNLFFQNYDTSTTNEDDCNSCTSNNNPIAGNPNLAPLGNFGGPTPTMLPLPSSAAICAGSSSLIPTGVTTDQRGFANTNTTYPGYSSNNACVDLGAVQTNYALTFSTEPSPIAPAISIVANADFAAGVELQESHSPFTAAPVTIPLSLSGTGTLTGGSAATSTTGAAAYSTLAIDTPGNGDILTANLALNPNLPSLILSSPSTQFSVAPATVSVAIGTSPAGLAFFINGIPYVATQNPSLTIGTRYILSTSTPQNLSQPGIQYVFSKWSDGTTNLTDLLTPTSSTTSDTAEFATQYLLTVSAGTGGTIAAATSPNGFYNSGTSQAITATPNPGYYFTGWTGANSPTDIASATSPTTTVTMNGPENLTANFALIPSYTVTTLNDDATGNAGNCATPSSNCTLRDAITATDANGGGAGTITFQSGLTGTITLASLLPNLNGQITITGPGANLVSISGNNSETVAPIFYVLRSTAVSISGLTLTGGNNGIEDAGTGGAIINISEGNLTLVDDIFTNNSAYGAGGAVYSNGQLTVIGCTFSSNQATNGRGGALAANGSLVVEYSTFSGNTAGTGGNGGAISAGVVTTIASSTFAGNTTAGSGGAVFALTRQVSITNSIFSGNQARISAAVGGPANSSFNLFYNNLDTQNGGTGQEDDCGVCTTNSSPIAGNPNLAPLGNYGGTTPTMFPLPASAAICAASSSLIPTAVTTDQRGLPNSTTYNSTACTDLGAVQTKYSLSFTSTPPASGTVPGTAMSPQTVTVDESGNLLTGGSASVSVTDANSDLTTTPATAPTTSGVAGFSSLIFTGPTTGDTLIAALALNPNLPSLILASAPSGSFNVSQASQTITFTGLPNAATYTSPNATYALNASASSGLPIAYSVSGLGSIQGTTLTITGAGSVVVTASQTGNTNYKAATPVSLTIKVSQASQTITPASIPTATTYGTGPYTLNATASSGLPVSYSVSGPATLAGTTLTITGAGNVIITETQAGNTNYLAASKVTQAIVVTAVPLASISPGSLNFGTLYLGSILTKTVTIADVGDAAMTIKDPLIAIVQGGNSSEFITVNLCPASLAPGKSCVMTVTFVAGPFYTTQTATLTINDNVAGSPQTVMLTATVIDPVPAFSATSLSFGTVKTSTASAAKSITVTNVGGTALTISKIAFADADLGDFSQTNTCTASLAPKGTCTISVTFKPGARGARTATLVVTDNAFNSPQSIPLSGTGD